MLMVNDLNALSSNRDALLLAEVAGWLHMIAKYQRKFIENPLSGVDIKVPDVIKCKYTSLDGFFNGPHLENLWKSLIKDNGRITIEEIICEHRSPEKAITPLKKIFFDSHGRGSGTDKSINENGYSKPYPPGTVFLSTALGKEKTQIDSGMIENQKDDLYCFLQKELSKLDDKFTRNINWGETEWQRWRIYFIEHLQMKFSQTIAEDRIPINDISLWDQTASTVAFLKPMLAEALLGGPKDEYMFRVLQIMTPGMEYLSQSTRISDLLYRKSFISDCFDRVKTLLEVKYPLGLEIFRDSNRIAFLVSSLENLLDIRDIDSNKSLKDIIRESFFEGVDGEIGIDSKVSNKGTRNVFYIGNELKTAVGDYSPSFKFLDDCWYDNYVDRCIVCQVRPRGYVAKSLEKDKTKRDQLKLLANKRKICGHCLKRLAGRSERWAKARNGNTIWLDEVADQNGRIALITAKFDLSRWQNGEMISTQRNITISISYKEFMNNFRKSGGATLGNVNGLSKVINKTWRDVKIDRFEQLQVTEEDLHRYPLSREEKLALAVWRKTPSFARIRRIWETTQILWQEIRDDFPAKVGERPARILLTGTFEPDYPAGELSDFNSYIAEMKGKGVRFTIVALENGEFYITENLQWLALKLGAEKKKVTLYSEAVNFVQEELLKDVLVISEFEQMDRRIGVLRSIKTDIDPVPYLPSVEVLSEPERFMAIVPADKALEVATAIQQKYCREMGKVRNRLPLSVGLVFAPSHTPLTALLDAGQRMMRMNTEEEEWTLTAINPPPKPDVCEKFYRLEFENKQIWDIPAMMGDETTSDIWYPYFYLKDKNGGDPIDRPMAFKGPGGWLAHVTELRKGDKVKITPSRFDFEFLDSAARRFELSYERKDKDGPLQRRDEEKRPRPYYLDDLDRLKQIKEILFEQSGSQIYQITELIEAKRAEWEKEKGSHDILKEFVRNTLRNARWRNRPAPEKLEELTEAGVNGQLHDVVELYGRILKCEFEGERE